MCIRGKHLTSWVSQTQWGMYAPHLIGQELFSNGFYTFKSSSFNIVKETHRSHDDDDDNDDDDDDDEDWEQDKRDEKAVDV